MAAWGPKPHNLASLSQEIQSEAERKQAQADGGGPGQAESDSGWLRPAPWHSFSIGPARNKKRLWPKLLLWPEP